jgi:hypothetical protein
MTLRLLRRGKPLAILPDWCGQLLLTCSFEIISRGDTGGGLVATQLVLHGIHTGSLVDDSPPTGRTVAYPGGFLSG